MYRFAIALCSLALGACLEAPDKLSGPQFDDLMGTRGPPDGFPDAEVGDSADVPDTTVVDIADTTPDTDATVADTSPDTDATVADTSPDTDATVADTTPDTDATVADTTLDTDATDTDDCSTEPLRRECLPSSQPLAVFEPIHSDTTVGPPLSLVRQHRADGTSTSARSAEPIEVALTNGTTTDPDLAAHFTFEDSLASSVPGYNLSGPATAYEASQVAFGKALQVAPRFLSPVTPSRASSLTLAAWFRLDPIATSAYDLIGFGQPAQPFAPELTLGIADGQWSAHLNNTTITFGAVSAGWQHVALTWDAATQRATLYLDGVARAVRTLPLDLTGPSFFVGAAFPTGSHNLGPPPSVDDVSVYSRALAPSEVRARAQLNRPLGAALLDAAQPDYDDLRVYDGTTSISREIIGRRPHGDSGAELEGVIGVWPLDDGSLAPRFARSGFGGFSDGLDLTQEIGVFGDPAGAVHTAIPGKVTIADQRGEWGTSLTIELWLRVAPSEATQTCETTTDGATVLVAQDGQGSPDQGFALRLCAGAVDFATSVTSVRGATPIADDRWHHLMVSFGPSEHRIVLDGAIDGTSTATGTPADMLRGVALLHRPPPQGRAGDPPRMSDITLDEIVIHDSVKSPGYAFNRAWPRRPHVRFLAATRPETAGRFPLPGYELRAGNDAVLAPKINACDSLISTCTGYVAWWRFDGDTFDASTAALHLTPYGTPSWSEGLDGNLALTFNGVDQSLERTRDAAFGLAQWTLEAAARPLALGTLSTLIERPGQGIPPDVPLNYGLRISESGRVRHQFIQATPPGEAAEVTQPLLAGVWASLGGAHAPTALSAFANATEATVTPTTTPVLDSQGGPLFIARGGRSDARAYFAGDLDAIRIMNRAVTPAERLKYPPLAWQPK